MHMCMSTRRWMHTTTAVTLPAKISLSLCTQTTVHPPPAHDDAQLKTKARNTGSFA